MNSLLNKLSKLKDDKLLIELKKIDIGKLKSLKEYLDDKYYNTEETCEFNDFQYDILKDLITEIEGENYIHSIGSKVREDDNRVKLPVWLGSLDKIKPEDKNKLNNWVAKNNFENYIVENKLDGVSCLYECKKGNVKLYTRGDGSIGADITHLLEYIKNIPKVKIDIMIRGELIMKEKTFKSKYSDTVANSRNMISGLVNAKSLRIGLYDVDFVTYEIISNEDYQSNPSKQFNMLEHLGFQVVSNKIINKTELNVEKLSEILIYNKSLYEYEIDGIIIQPDEKYIRNLKDNPKYAFAFKINTFVEAIVEGVEWNISKYKLLKPRIKIKPVNLNGVNINYASGSNAKNIFDNSIGKGAVVKLTRSGDVIPYIFDVIKAAEFPDMPTISYKWNENKVDIIVEDDENNISDIKMISSFFSGMGIKNISDSTVEKIYNAGYKTLKSILKAKKEDFQKIDGFQKTLSEKIYNNIHNGLQNITLDLLIGSACVFGEGIGRKKVKSLLDNFPDILEINMSEKDMIEKIKNIEGFSDKTAEKIVNNIDKVKKFLKDIEKYVSYEKSAQLSSNKLEGKSILFSGYRPKELMEIITKNGGTIASTVNKTLSILIVKDKDSHSSKIETAKKFGIEILYENEFIDNYLLF